MKRRAPHASAEREALEEAGVVGQVGKRAIGSFSYEKRLKQGDVILCEVHVFPLEVKRQQKNWPEKGKREVQWFSPSEAAERVQEPMLGAIIRSLQKRPNSSSLPRQLVYRSAKPCSPAEERLNSYLRLNCRDRASSRVRSIK
jgi:hypothetical protein